MCDIKFVLQQQSELKIQLNSINESQIKLYGNFVEKNEILLLGNNDEYEKNIYMHDKEILKNIIEKKMSSFVKSIKRFSYVFEEIYAELCDIPDFAIKYYAKYILFIVYTYQKNKTNLLEKTYDYLSTKFDKNDAELYLLFQKYSEFETKNTPQNNSVAQIPEVESFLENLKNMSGYDTNIIINDIKNKESLQNFVNYVKSNNMQELLNYAYDKSLFEIFVFVYIYYDVIFDYGKITNNTISSDIANNGVASSVRSGGGGKTGLVFEISGSLEKKKILDRLIYLKRYSTLINKNNYKFNKKYISVIRNVFLHKINI